MAHGTIVILEDEAENLRSLTRALEKVGYDVHGYRDPRKGMAFLDDHRNVDIVLTDIRMPAMDGMAVLKHVKENRPGLPVLLITAFGSVESAVGAMKVGADDYLAKPIDLYELRRRVEALVEKHRLAMRVDELQARLDERFGFENIVGTSRPMQELFQQIKMVAPTRATVLINGESGTGKELIANAIHHNSDRKRNRFLPINCAAIPATLMESELFGHERGSFTGAEKTHPGKFEQADRGTLFLDEIGELPIGLQAKLLRVLEERMVTRVGSSHPIPVDVRIVTATNRNIKEMTAAGDFRKDLFYRLKVVELRIPPLRERKEDIPLLAHSFLEQLNREHGRTIEKISPEALSALVAYPWPGNVRELRNVIERTVVFCPENEIKITHLPVELQSGVALTTHAGLPSLHAAASTGFDVRGEVVPLEEMERRAILRALEETGGNKTRAARLLGIGLRTLHRKLKQYRYDNATINSERSMQ